MKKSTLWLSAGIAICLFIGMSIPSFAQVNWAISTHRSIPMEAFDDAGYQQSWGISTDFLSGDKRIGPLALQGGFHFDYTGGGRSKMDVVLSQPENANAKMKVGNESMGMHGVARILSPAGFFRVYADGLLGTKLYRSFESINLRGAYPGYEDVTSDRVLESWTLSYGAAVGMQFRLSEGVSLDLRTTYLKGGDADFVDISSVTNPKVGRVEYNTLNAPSTDMMMVQVGFNFRLDDMGCTPSRCNMAPAPVYAPNPGEFSAPAPDCPPAQPNQPNQPAQIKTPSQTPQPAPTPRTPSVKPAPAPRPAANVPRRSAIKP